jgi:hypothetical protein
MPCEKWGIFIWQSMSKLYKFFFLLFCVLALVSFIYSTLVSWLTYQLVKGNTVLALLPDEPFSSFLRLGLIQGLLYALVLLIILLSLFQRSLRYGQKFTIRDIIKTGSWFYIATTLVYIIHYLTFSFLSFMNTGSLLLLGPTQLFLPSPLWFPFLLAWLILFIVLSTRIKKPV